MIHMLFTQADLIQYFLMVLSESNLANLRQWSQQVKKRKRKKDRKQTEKQNFLALHDLVRSSNKVFIESNSFRFWLASFLRQQQHRKEQESVVFVKEEFLHKKIQKKEDVFGYLTTNSLRKVSVKQNGLWRLVKTYTVIKKFDKVCS